MADIASIGKSVGKNIGIAFLLLLLAGFVTRGESAEEQEAERLGFSSIWAMESAHEKGWHTNAQYVADETARAERFGFVDIEEMHRADEVGARTQADYDRHLRDKERAQTQVEQGDFAQDSSQGAEFSALNLVPTKGDEVKEKIATTFDCYMTVNFTENLFRRPDYQQEIPQDLFKDLSRAKLFWDAEYEAMKSYLRAENAEYHLNYLLSVSIANSNLTKGLTPNSAQFKSWQMWSVRISRACVTYIDVGNSNTNSWQSFL